MKDKDTIINIENIVYGGYGLGRIDGKIFFVDSGIPGDSVKISIREEHKDYSIAGISEIVKQSPLRVQPECPVYGICGGCSYMHVSYATELEFKRTIIKDQLKRVADITDAELPSIETVSGSRFGYRSHTRYNTDGSAKGFFRKQSNVIVPFPEQGCLLLSDELNNGIKKYTAVSTDSEVRASSDHKRDVYFSSGNKPVEVTEKECGIYYRRDINGFFQANRFLRESMIRKVEEFSGLRKKDTFLDICSGCGFFALPLALSSNHGYGFDIDPSSIRYAKKNAKLNDINNTVFYNIPESEIKPHLYEPDAVVIDPPRSGLSKKGRRTVNAISPGRIVYVSCNPSTFARDLKDFMKNGYRLEKLIFIDMFPCTHHIELIGLLKKSDVPVKDQVN